jgi:hypothetical protein
MNESLLLLLERTGYLTIQDHQSMEKQDKLPNLNHFLTIYYKAYVDYNFLQDIHSK